MRKKKKLEIQRIVLEQIKIYDMLKKAADSMIDKETADAAKGEEHERKV